MRITLRAVGRLKDGPERALVDDYLARAQAAARSAGLKSVQEIELSGKDDRAASSAALRKSLHDKAPPGGLKTIVLDERGAALTSRELAQRLGAWRDGGLAETAWLIGAADGVDQALRARADLLLAFGRVTWPHNLARAMAAEQIYRCVSLLSGGAYHRD